MVGMVKDKLKEIIDRNYLGFAYSGKIHLMTFEASTGKIHEISHSLLTEFGLRASMFHTQSSNSPMLSSFAPELLKFYAVEFLKSEEGFEFTFDTSVLQSNKVWMGLEEEESYSIKEDGHDPQAEESIEMNDGRYRSARCRGWFCFDHFIEGLNLVSIRFIEIEKIVVEISEESNSRNGVELSVSVNDSHRTTHNLTETQKEIDVIQSSRAMINNAGSPRQIKLIKELMFCSILLIIGLLVIEKLVRDSFYNVLTTYSNDFTTLIKRNTKAQECGRDLRKYEMVIK